MEEEFAFVLRLCFFCGLFLLFVFRVCLCRTVLSVPCSLVITCWEGSFVCDVALCSPLINSVSGQMWYLLASITSYSDMSDRLQ